MRTFLLLASGLLGGCAGGDHIAESYGTMQPAIVETATGPYWIYDKPDRAKLLVQKYPASAGAQGFAGGLNPPLPAPKPHYQQAADQYLSQTGRRCQIRDGYLVVEPSWEFAYECEQENVVTGALSAAEETYWHSQRRR